MSKCVLKFEVQEAKEDCGKDQIYVGMETVIDGGIHVMRLL